MGAVGGAAGPAQRLERAGQREEVDVVARLLGPRPVLAEPGETHVDQPLVAGTAHLGPEAEPLGHPGPEDVDQHVGPIGQRQQRVDTAGRLEVDRHPALAPRQGAARARHRHRPVDAEHVRAHVGEQHPGERTGTEAHHLEDTDPAERPGHGFASSSLARATSPSQRALPLGVRSKVVRSQATIPKWGP